MRKKILIIWLLCLGLSSVAQEVPRGIFFGQTPVKARFNDVLDIFGDKMALYDPEDNMLILLDGFNYRLPEGFVTFNTGAPLRIRLAGRVYMEAAVVSKDPVVIESNHLQHADHRLQRFCHGAQVSELGDRRLLHLRTALFRCAEHGDDCSQMSGRSGRQRRGAAHGSEPQSQSRGDQHPHSQRLGHGDAERDNRQ